MNRNDVLPKLRTHEVVVCELENESLVYDLSSHKVACLNRWARIVADRCDGTTTVGQVVDLIRGDGSEEDAQLVVEEVLDRLGEAGLLASAWMPAPDQLPRRSVLKAAAALGAALPFVSMLVAPTSAEAQSCIGNSEECVPDGTPCFRAARGTLIALPAS